MTLANYPQVLFQNRRPDRIATLEEYRASGGYQALDGGRDTARSRREVQEIVLDAALLGRGGAAFPAGRKMMTIAEDAPFPRYLVCNADEMEPGTFKDRVLIHADPHMLIEGIVITAWAVRAEQAIIFIRPEYENAARILEREIRIAAAAGYLGRGILGSDYGLEIVVHRSAGRYICGEVTAQLNALMGRRPNPKQPPPYATEKGLWDQPTLAHNVETLACLPHIVRNGAEWFKKLALTATGAGTKIFGVSGKVKRPGCYELPIGVPLSEIIEEYAGGMLRGLGVQGVPARRGLHRLPAPAALRRPDGFRRAEEGRQPPGHRRHHGLRPPDLPGGRDPEPDRVLRTRILRVVHAVPRGAALHPRSARAHRGRVRGSRSLFRMLEEMKVHLYRSYCAFAPGAAAPLESLLAHFKDEIQEHIREKRCPFKKEPGPAAAGLVKPRFIA